MSSSPTRFQNTPADARDHPDALNMRDPTRGGSVKTVETQIDIAATAGRVWQILTDFLAYFDWNPFITEIEGRPEPGGRLRVRMCPPGRSAITVKPIIRSQGSGLGAHRQFSGRCFGSKV
jgi:Polyketide cyclase / dehydrase and lipid transport